LKARYNYPLLIVVKANKEQIDKQLANIVIKTGVIDTKKKTKNPMIILL
jgi:hypothetical protein